MVELLIFAALAAVVLSMLYSVLGRRVGRQPEEARETGRARLTLGQPAARAEEPKGKPALTGLDAIRARDSSFEPSRFLDGARAAYQMIVKAYAAGDREALKGLTTAPVLTAFDRAIASREAENRTEQVEFLQPPRADVDDVSLSGDTARVRVRFLTELRRRIKDAAGEAVDDHRTAEIWTFERAVTSRDPNWALARVEAAEA